MPARSSSSRCRRRWYRRGRSGPALVLPQPSDCDGRAWIVFGLSVGLATGVGADAAAIAAMANPPTERGPPATPPAASSQRTADPNVEPLFATSCGWCHQGGGRVAGRGPKLAGTDKTDEFIIGQIKHGKPPGMPAFGRSFNDEQIQAIVAYIRGVARDAVDRATRPASRRVAAGACSLSRLRGPGGFPRRRARSPIEARGVISLCAHPNALPFASRKANRPGSRSSSAARSPAARRRLDVAWVVSPIQYRSAECDIILDTIVDQQVQAEGRVRVSRPYHRSGVALALPAGRRWRQLVPRSRRGKRIGVQVGSLAQMILGRRGRDDAVRLRGRNDRGAGAGTLDGAAVSPAAIG